MKTRRTSEAKYRSAGLARWRALQYISRPLCIRWFGHARLTSSKFPLYTRSSTALANEWLSRRGEEPTKIGIEELLPRPAS